MSASMTGGARRLWRRQDWSQRVEVSIMTATKSVYEAAGGMEGMRRLAAAWHRRVMADEVVSHAFSHGFHPDHTERLAAYWVEALGGPNDYSTAFGTETAVVR